MISILDRCRAHAGPETDAKALRKAVTTCVDTPGYYFKYINRHQR